MIPEAVGSLLFIARRCRPDVECAVNTASQLLNNYSREHFKAVKKISTYLKFSLV